MSTPARTPLLGATPSPSPPPPPPPPPSRPPPPPPPPASAPTSSMAHGVEKCQLQHQRAIVVPNLLRSCTAGAASLSDFVSRVVNEALGAEAERLTPRARAQAEDHCRAELARL